MGKIIEKRIAKRRFMETKMLAEIYLESRKKREEKRYTFTQGIRLGQYIGILGYNRGYNLKNVKEQIMEDISGDEVIEEAKRKILEKDM